jgi:hypothetical protein
MAMTPNDVCVRVFLSNDRSVVAQIFADTVPVSKRLPISAFNDEMRQVLEGVSPGQVVPSVWSTNPTPETVKPDLTPQSKRRTATGREHRVSAAATVPRVPPASRPPTSAQPSSVSLTYGQRYTRRSADERLALARLLLKSLPRRLMGVPKQTASGFSLALRQLFRSATAIGAFSGEVFAVAVSLSGDAVRGALEVLYVGTLRDVRAMNVSQRYYDRRLERALGSWIPAYRRAAKEA